MKLLNYFHISNVNVDKTSENYRIYVNFVLNNKMNFYIPFLKIKNWTPDCFFHENVTPMTKQCPFCNELLAYTEDKVTVCHSLEKYSDEIMNKVINHPNVRLRILFLKNT